MNTSLLIRLLTTCLLFTTYAICSDSWSAPPNVVMIVADDMAWDDCGAFGHPTIRTPNIDQLARNGLRFENAFLTISSCSPSRCSILTGLYPHNTDAEELHWPLPSSKSIFVEALRNAGYWTGAAGKWHLGNAMRDRFDVIREVDTSGFQLPTNSQGKRGQFAETSHGDARSGCADWVRLLQQRPTDQPFFVWLAAVDPHRPYSENIVPQPHRPSDVRLPPYHPDTPDVRKDYTLYYDEIHRLDDYVGKVVAELKRQNVDQNTMLIFFSDNGRPFPRDKTTIYDSGIKTPLIISWPSTVPAGESTKSLVSSVDFASTICDIAGLGSRFAPSPGKSFRPVLHDPRKKTRDYVFAEKNWHDYEDHSRAVRDERFKYIRNYYYDLPNTPPADAVRSETFQFMQREYATGKLPAHQSQCFHSPRPKEELYDIAADPHEINNLANRPAHKATLQRFRDELRRWESTTKDTVPELRTADEFDRKAGTPTPARRRPRWSKRRMVAEGLVAP